MALLAAIFFASYLITGRSLRRRLPVLLYTWLVFVAATFVSVGVIVVAGAPVTGYSDDGYLAIIALTIASQMLAHPGFNYSLGYFSATILSLSGQLVTVVGAVMAFIVFSQMPSVVQIIGSAIMLTGVLLAGRK